MCNSKCYDVISIVVSLILQRLCHSRFFLSHFLASGFLFGFLLSLTALLLRRSPLSRLLARQL
jgi:hypothetical protein